ncbi:MAG: hypothetical protein FWG25_04785 [Promicromonosporaceae bacterium]|nr:hypothetical protein [Promicromonosporaceae bacterium]
MSARSRRANGIAPGRERKSSRTALNAQIGSGLSWEAYETAGSSALAIVPDELPEQPHLTLVPPPASTDPVGDALAEWRSALLGKLEPGALDDIRNLGPKMLELTTCHPTGLVQLYANRNTRMSSLFRDELAYSHAAGQAELVYEQLELQSGTAGMARLHLATGVAVWREEGTPPEQRHNAEVAQLAKVTVEPHKPEAHHDAQENAQPDVRQAAQQVGSTPVSATHPDTHPDTAPNLTVIDGGATEAHTSHTAPAPQPTPTRPRRMKDVRVPVLLHPITLERNHNGEFELTLEGTPFLNPRLAREIQAHGGVLDLDLLMEQTISSEGFSPTEALGRMEALGIAMLNRFEMIRRSMVGIFTHPGQSAIADLEALEGRLREHRVVRALAGDYELANELRSKTYPEPQLSGALSDRGIGNLDRTQHLALAAVNTRDHLFINAPVGTDPEQLIAAILADSVSRNRNVLYVGGQRRLEESLKRRLAALDLDDLILDIQPKTTWRADLNLRLLNAMHLEGPTVPEFARRDEFVGVHTQLDDYVAGLHRTHQPWGTSIYRAFHRVAQLTAAGGVTTVRFSPEVLERLTLDARTRLGSELISAAHHGAFLRTTALSPWYGANLTDAHHAEVTLNRVTRLSATNLPALSEKIAFVAETGGLRTAETVDEFGELLRMLAGMRGTLDLFLPKVYERSVKDLIHATTPRKERKSQLGGPGFFAVRKLRKQAREMIRPGARITDLSAALTKVEAQREVWADYATKPGWPVLPTGLSEIERLFDAVRIDLRACESVLEGTSTSGSLTAWPIGDLTERLRALAADDAALTDLPARERALRELRRAGLKDLIADLTEREVTEETAITELDLAWWGSLLQTVLDKEPTVAQTDPARLEILVRRFRELDAEHSQTLGSVLKSAWTKRISEALHHGVLANLYSVLVSERPPSIRELMGPYGDQIHSLRPVFLARPQLVPQLLPAERSVDVVILDRIHSQNVSDIVGAIARAKQVIVIGDPEAAAGDATSALAAVLPMVTLRPVGSRRDVALTNLLSSHGYGSQLGVAPLPRAAIPVAFEQVEGRGTLVTESLAIGATVESAPQAEVRRAVQYAGEHARFRADESLALVTLTAAHAEAIAEHLTEVVAADRTLAGFFGPNQAESVVVCAAADIAGLRRDTVVFSLGLGRTPHGRVLHEFGPLADERGAQLLNGVIGVARKRLQVISSFGSEDLDAERTHGEGPSYLLELLDLARYRTVMANTLCTGTAATRNILLTEIGDLLASDGLLVAYDFGSGDGTRIPMVVGHPNLPQEWLVAVYDDGPEYASEPSLRMRDRKYAGELTDLGWTVTQVWSVAAFLDPGTEADRIRSLVTEALEARLSGQLDTAPIPVVPAPVEPAPQVSELEAEWLEMLHAPLWDSPPESRWDNPLESRENTTPSLTDFVPDYLPQPSASPEVELRDYLAPVLAAPQLTYLAPVEH